MSDNSDDIIVPWRTLAAVSPQLTQWYVQRYGPIPDDDPGVDEKRYLSMRAEYMKEYGL